MEQKQGTYYFQLNILFFAMMAGAFMLALVAALVLKSSETTNPELENILVPLCVLWAVGAVVAADRLVRKQLSHIRQDQPLETRQATFRSAFILQLALLEGAALFAIVSYMLTGSTLAIITGIALIGWMSVNRPSIARLEKYLMLTSDEKEALFG
ncbi:MAG: hypothetical protein NWR72_04205 [Bacteroidia bacterium]|nr:hypothetical protein [Bacteroidia bacterium]